VHAGGVEGLTRKAAVYLLLLLVAMLWARDARGQEPGADSRPRADRVAIVLDVGGAHDRARPPAIS
jgi:hypothetical protein